MSKKYAVPTGELADAARESWFHPDDPPYLKLAWQRYVDAGRKDRARAAEAGRKRVHYGQETQMALDAYWRAVEVARAEGYPAFARLDGISPRPMAIDKDGDYDDD